MGRTLMKQELRIQRKAIIFPNFYQFYPKRIKLYCDPDLLAKISASLRIDSSFQNRLSISG